MPPGGPQRPYPAAAQPVFAPTITQEMRLRHQVAPPQQPYRPAEPRTEWTTTAIALPGQRKSWSARRIVALIGVCVLAVALLVMLLIALLVFGPAALVVVPLAALPLIVVVGVIWLLDRWRPQSPIMMALCVLWGAAASVVMTLVLGLGAEIAYALTIGAPPDWVGPVIHAPLFEESTKGVLLLAILIFARKHFDGPLQGLLFGSLIGIGFAFTEDILYIGTATMAGQELGAGGGIVAGGLTFFLRGVLTPFAHVAFTGAIGLIMGFGARRPGLGWGIGLFFAGLPVGMLLHGLWNLIASTSLTFLLDLLVAALMGFLCFAGWLTAALLLRRDEVKRTRQALEDYAQAGWLTPAEAEMFGSWAGRRKGRAWAARFPGGKPIMQKMIRTSALLAVLRHRILLNPRTTGAERASEAKLLAGFTRLRSELLQRAGMPG
ncbi:PrsW family intramembrane metalloprotease [Sediminivirga luteola]|uniref:PrsW family intramembrane metalloprotease n=1 Tax=Sediminivirga luteola TaxID=1774748 RepID=UPI00166384AE|nr:PrsW family intramembrane metalloprotease [Sediminivirga luteola]MCI2265303.1 PrsW family intramembrane metalloprotease [Sediminivirga luteola]